MYTIPVTFIFIFSEGGYICTVLFPCGGGCAKNPDKEQLEQYASSFQSDPSSPGFLVADGLMNALGMFIS